MPKNVAQNADGLEKISNVEIAVYALYLCGGVDKKIHTEHVAQRCYELIPERFSWRLYQLPDKEPARVALYDAMKDEKGGLVQGRAGSEAKGKELDGWVLTRSGVKWLKANEARIASLLKGPKKETSRQEREKFQTRITDSPAYKKFLADGSVDLIKDFEFTELLRCSPDASAETMQKKFDALIRKAEEVESKLAIDFLEHCQNKFRGLLYR